MEEVSALPTTAVPVVPVHPIDCTLAPKLNLADYQNAVPVVRDLTVINESEEDLSALDLTLESMPAFLKPRTWRIDGVRAKQRCRIPDLDVKLDGSLLVRLTEAEQATVCLILRRRDGGGDEVARLEKVVELLPRNQWGGLSYAPELVAAFVQPNEPQIERLLKKAADILRKNGKNAALDGYAGGAKRAWEIASALWSAVGAMGLDYALPPASFEYTGQKVRSSQQIADSGLGTCLDLSLMFASALEQAGLDPVVVFTKDHAFSGVWLRTSEFSSAVIDDVTALRKRIKLKELVLFETTIVTHRPCPSFSYAAKLGSDLVAEDKQEQFELAIDVRRARLQRIKPLASAEAVPSAPDEHSSIVAEPAFDEAPELSVREVQVELDAAKLSPRDRLARWQRKLLDLSLRNALLNFRGGKKSITLVAPAPAELEDILSDGVPIKLLPRPDLMEGADPRSQAIYESREHEDVRRTHALEALGKREVFVGVPLQELDARLVDLYRSARSTLQEGGSNTLFLALGFLSWTQDDKAERRYRAPLILIPVTLERKSVRSGFTLKLHDDEPRFNPTLIEMLRQDFKLELGVADGELPKDEAGLDVVAIWNSVSKAIKDLKGWEVVEDVVLAMFSFAKYLMWKDLTERTDQLRENAVVRHLIDTPRDPYPPGTSFPAPSDLDRDLSPEQTFCPLPADSSQLSAVMAGVRGKDFVLIGPPGTGKSQTIANLIAQCLAENKRVLFVSEKIAALDVVYRRLREVGLGEFCLELHSNKARKLDVLAQLQRSWHASGNVDPVVWRSEAQRLRRLRDELNRYVEKLHLRHGNGLTIFEAIGRVVSRHDDAIIALSWATPHAHDAAGLAALREIVDRTGANALAVDEHGLFDSAVSTFSRTEWSPSWQRAVVDASRSVVDAARKGHLAALHLLEEAGLPLVVLDRRGRQALNVLLQALATASELDWSFAVSSEAPSIGLRLRSATGLLRKHRELTGRLTSPWSDDVMSGCHRGLQLLREMTQLRSTMPQPWPIEATDGLKLGIDLLDKIGSLERQLSVRYSDAIHSLDVVALHRALLKAEKTIWPLSWFALRDIKGQLERCVVGAGEPDASRDLALLVELRLLKERISTLKTHPSINTVWQGLDTKGDVARAGLRFQHCLKAAIQGRAWIDASHDHVAAGRCGDDLAISLAHIRNVTKVRAQIASLNSLGGATKSLWAGEETNEPHLEAALSFQTAKRTLIASGSLAGNFELVEQGLCGTDALADLRIIRERADIEHQLSAYEDLCAVAPGTWRGLQSDEEIVNGAVSFQGLMANALTGLVRTPEIGGVLSTSLARLLSSGRHLLQPGGAVDEAGRRYVVASAELDTATHALGSAAGFAQPSFDALAELPLEAIGERAQSIVQSERSLHAWCSWRKVRDEACASGLAPLIDAVESRAVAAAGVRDLFETNYCRWWLDAVVEQEPVIRGFVAVEHQKRIDDFRVLDDRFTELTKAWVRASLCADLPQADSVTRNSEWGILRHEITKKKRHMPLRELMTSIPTALTKLTPCLLMSPLSIAQFLAADASTFDVVVFDEASQIPIWDAIGAIARGKQVVMVGDPKQLPPTNFFDRAEADDDEDTEGDQESILDECMGANLPTLNLRWHYRSRHESLIAFSNHRYYGGSLVTFPSPTTNDRAVSFNFVPGVYEKGGARTNKVEAKALVTDLVERLKAPGFRESRKTIGVVTFNAEQQTLIEDLLDEERRKDPSIEGHFAETEIEPVFVKNLESVQGDERDIMYFSITYGPDARGAVSMNFGPMNRQGGERRLNVAITRAREELRVFSSLRPDQMDLGRTQANGVRDLKHFLEFAERGPRALVEAAMHSVGGFDSPFEMAVAAALSRRGWEVTTQVGVSGFRIDLGIVHPDAKGKYLAGVECDGATYHRSATARDRDKLREQILRGLGWEIVRLWSTDWWLDPIATASQIDKKLNVLLEKSRVQTREEAEREAALAAARILSRAAEEASRPTTTALEEESSEIEPLGQALDAQPSEEAIGSRALSDVYARSVPERTQFGTTFVEARAQDAVSAVDPESFFDPGYDATLLRMIDHVVSKEGPVLDVILARRIARAHGWQRTGARIQSRIDELASSRYKHTKDRVGVFFWPLDVNAGSAVSFRSPAPGCARQVDEICLEELVDLMRRVSERGDAGERAIVAAARELGLLRVGVSVRDRLLEAAASAMSN